MTACFSKVVFAITDWSDERKFLGAFRDEFGIGGKIEFLRP